MGNRLGLAPLPSSTPMVFVGGGGGGAAVYAAAKWLAESG